MEPSGSPCSEGLLRLFPRLPSLLLVLHRRTSILTVLSTSSRLATVSRVLTEIGSAIPFFVGFRHWSWSVHRRLDRGACCLIAAARTGAVPQVYQPTQHPGLDAPLNAGICAMLLIARCDDYKERPCVCPSTSGRWAIVSSVNMLTEVPFNHRVVLLGVSGSRRIQVRLRRLTSSSFLSLGGSCAIGCDTGKGLLM